MLIPSTHEAGLWINPNWRDGEAGAFAVVIGVSRYAHLEGGEAQVAQTYGLGQLRVSALTAYNFFRWIAETYYVEDCPVAKVWLLLSPTQDELAFQDHLAINSRDANFDNCKDAIGGWWAQMSALPAEAAKHSRALFFFSGHGLEIHHEQQILLPGDFLSPPQQNWNDAISTQNLKNGLASLTVPKQFFFIDACRNDHYELRKKRITGTSLLREDEAALSNPALVAPVLYATASGQQAYQQPDPQKGLSLYGQALLDGLRGKPDIELKQRAQRWSVDLYPLQSFVTEQVMDRLRQAQADVIQPVKLSGIVDNQPITYLDLAQIRSVRSAPGQATTDDVQLLAAGARNTQQRSENLTRQMNNVYTVKKRLGGDMRRHIWANNFNIGHDLFGNEQVTELWSHAIRVCALSDGNWIDRPDVIKVHEISRTGDTRSYQVELSIDHHDPAGHWVELVDTAQVAHACVLPDDRYDRPRYVLEFDLSFEESGLPRHVIRLEAYLSTNNDEPLQSVARLWQRYRTADVNGAVNSIAQSAVGAELGDLVAMTEQVRDMHVLEDLVRHKLRSPLSATVAALTLLRANRLDLLHTWLRNLANWCEERTDGPALWAEQIMRQQRDRNSAAIEAAEYLIKLNKRGLPHISEGLSYAAGLTERLLVAGRFAPPGTSRQELGRLQERISGAMSYFRPGGLFATYSGFAAGTDPRTIVGP